MTEHWNWALAHVRGDWVTVIGDDDGLTRGALARIDEVLREHPDVEHITSERAGYHWPGVSGSGAPRLTVIKDERGIRPRDMGALRTSALAGLTPWHQLPMLYTGHWVRKCTLDQIKDSRGSVLRALYPDVYSSAAFLCAIGRAVKVSETLAIMGVSRHSNGMSAGKGESTIPGTISGTFLAETAERAHQQLDTNPPNAVPTSDYAMFIDAWLHAAHLHPNWTLDWRRQIDALFDSALSTYYYSPIVRDREITRARRIAELNGLDGADVLRRAYARKRLHYQSPATALQSWRTLTARYEATEPMFALRNVFEASLAVDQLQKRFPSIAVRAQRALRFGASRMRHRLSAALGAPDTE